MSLGRGILRPAFARCLAALLFLAASTRADGVDDASRNAARDLAQQGKAAFARGEFENASDLFRRAYALVPAPTLAVYEGRSLVQMQKLVEGEEAFVRALRTPISDESPDQFRDAVQAADSELVQLRPRVPKVTLVAKGPGAEHPELRVTIDGIAVKRALLGIEMPVNPGSHQVTANAPGGEVAQQTFSIGEKERTRVEIEVPAGAVEPAPAPLPSPPVAETPRVSYWSSQRIVAVSVAGVGGLGLGTGIVTGLLSASKHSDAEAGCEDNVCIEGTAGADALDDFRTLRAISTVSYIVGALGVAGGGALFFTAPPPSSGAASVQPFIGVGRAGVMGAF